MGRPRDEEVRICGPYLDKDKQARGLRCWKTLEIVPGEKRRWKYHDSEQDAKDEVEGSEREKQEAAETTVSQLIELYVEQHLTTVKKNRPSSRYAARWNLHRYFQPVLMEPINVLTERVCKECRTGKWKMVKGQSKPTLVVDGLATRRRVIKLKDGKTRLGAPATSTSQLNTIGFARTFTKWATKAGHLKADPMLWFDPNMEAVREHGSKGQTKLSLGQAERLLRSTADLAAAEAGKGRLGDRATAVTTTLVTGLRASTVVNLTVSNVERREGEPWILWAPRAKKRGAVKLRPYPLEPELQVLIERQMAGKQSTDRLFGEHRREWLLKAVRKMCDLAGVPQDTAHAIRGMLANREAARGNVSGAQRMLDHERGSTTTSSYTSDAALATGEQRRILAVLNGGRR